MEIAKNQQEASVSLSHKAYPKPERNLSAACSGKKTNVGYILKN